MNIAEIMTTDVECVRPTDTIGHAARRMRDLDIGSLPICGEDDRLTGIVTDRDITIRATASGWDPESTSVRNVMTPRIIYCFEDQSIEEAAKLMEERQIRRLPVLSHDKRLVGIVSLGDIAVKYGDDSLCGEALELVSEPAFVG